MALSYKMVLGWQGAVVTGQFDPARTGINQTLSVDKLSVTSPSTTNLGVAMSITGHSTGKWCFEYTVTVGATGASNYYQSIGICPAGWSTTDINTGLVGGSINLSIGLRDDTGSPGSLYMNGSVTGGINTFGEAVNPGGTGICAIDLDNKLIWYKGSSTAWQNLWYNTPLSSCDPVAGIGGVSFAAVTGAPYYIGAGGRYGQTYKINFTGTTQTPTFGAPSGYSWWG